MAQRKAAAESHGPAGLALLVTVLGEVGEENNSVLGGLMVAGADGSLLAAEARVEQPDLVAGMAALAAGTAARIAGQVAMGEYAGCLIEGSSGQVAVYPLTAHLVLVMLSRRDVTPGLFTTTAKKVLPRLRAVAAEVGARPTGSSGAAAPAGESGPVLPMPLKDIPRIDLSMVDKGRTESR
jgi:predicted regulator of Ras-like GTPase activity (Roadblock/LC7/MglB family)